MSASSTCAVQMLLVAFSRRMCCSRGLQREAQRGRPGVVDRHADEAAGDVALVLLAGGEEPGVRAAVAQRHAEALRGADDDVGAPLPRRDEQHQREQIGGDRHERALRVQVRHQLAVVADRTVGARVLEQHAEHALGRQVGFGLAHDHVDPDRLGAGAHDVDRLRMALGVDEEHVARLRVGPPQQRHRLGRGGRFVEQRRVGQIHAR